MAVRDEPPLLCLFEPPAVDSNLPRVERRLLTRARAAGWRVHCEAVIPAGPDTRALDETPRDAGAALVVLSSALSLDAEAARVSCAALRRRFPQALLVGSRSLDGVDLVLTSAATVAALERLLGHAEDYWRQARKLLELHRELGVRAARIRQLSDIAIALSGGRDFDELLAAILLEARRLAGCEAGSLYLIEEGSPPALVFKVAQNDVVDVPFSESRLPLEPSSLAGYVAVSGEPLTIDDVYDLPPEACYGFNDSFDRRWGYRTCSMLVLPMRDHRGKVVGVLQFINRIEETGSRPVPFDDEIAELLRAVASQAAVSIQKDALLRDVNNLFESFVQASVKTIEQRDPSTSGHSFRVADTTVALLEALPRSDHARFRNLSFSPDHIREVRYAALLHDFGKVGVRERVLLKANKLSEERLQILQYRIELEKERQRRRAVERELELLHHGAVDFEVARRRIHRDLERRLTLLDDYFECLCRANEPNLLADGAFDHLGVIRDYPFEEFDGTTGTLIADSDLLALSVRQGSLTPVEREEIQRHVRHTREFLDVLPWPPELAQVPRIAGAHHEKLDGSGYPDGLAGEEIPLASRVMTVCDIYDALTAMDRPYKKAISPERAFDILADEARRGLLDADLVEVFIRAGIYRRAPRPPRQAAGHGQGSSHSSSTETLIR